MLDAALDAFHPRRTDTGGEIGISGPPAADDEAAIWYLLETQPTIQRSHGLLEYRLGGTSRHHLQRHRLNWQLDVELSCQPGTPGARRQHKPVASNQPRGR